MDDTEDKDKRRCSHCRRSDVEFGRNKRNRDGLHHLCKVCDKVYRNRPEVLSRNRAYDKQKYQLHGSEKRAYQRERTTGWSDDAFKTAWEAQNGICALCPTKMLPTGQKTNSVCADHDHVTGITRALICQKCNRLLGMFEKNCERFEAYLLRFVSKIRRVA